jgi:glycine cleavage system transcriptional repressor
MVLELSGGMNVNSAFAVVRAIGSDRIGVVDDITSVIEKAECNIEESKMSVLGGEFAVMMLVSGTESAIDALGGHDFTIGKLSDFSVDVKRTKEPYKIASGVPYLIETVSIDSLGIVHAVTAVLAQEQISIEELETDTTSAPFTGAPLFTLRIRVALSGPKRAAQLREVLQRLAYERDFDITVVRSVREASSTS